MWVENSAGLGVRCCWGNIQDVVGDNKIVMLQIHNEVIEDSEYFKYDYFFHFD